MFTLFHLRFLFQFCIFYIEQNDIQKYLCIVFGSILLVKDWAEFSLIESQLKERRVITGLQSIDCLKLYRLPQIQI